MSETTICPCDNDVAAIPTNLPNLTQIAYRAGTFRDFRRALLTPLQGPPPEYALTGWRANVTSDPALADLGVMMAEWWAYLADILTFYNERIANEDYLGTAMLPESPARLIGLLGYRPRPAIGATGTLAALVTPGQSATLPAGLQFQSKPGPGQAPQTFELLTATPIAAPDVVAANPYPPNLLSLPDANGNPSVLLVGSVTSVNAGALLLLGPRDDSASPTLATVADAPSVRTVIGGKQTSLSLALQSAAPALTAADARLQRPNQNIGLWTVNGSAVGATPSTVIRVGGFVIGVRKGVEASLIQLAGLARQIRPNDWVVFSAPDSPPQLVQVVNATDVLGDASTASGASPTTVGIAQANQPTPIPVLHTQLTLAQPLSQNLQQNVAGITVLFGWIDVGTLLDQPAGSWDATQPALAALQPAVFSEGNGLPIILQDSIGVAVPATGTSLGDGNLTVGGLAAPAPPLSPPLQPPLDVYYNLLPVTCGKTVANEVLGTGDATVPGQSFTLSQSPVTYLSNGAAYASTIALTVGGIPWKEVPSFYGQSPTAAVFVTREDAQNNTHVDFGDGINGALLPTGARVVATYRIGAGANSPPAGKLTVIAQSYPGLRAVQNPIAVSGGSDPDPPGLIKTDAPRSVLTFGRAVSIADYQAIAAQAGGVTMALAVWSWNAASQRAVVCVYVAGSGDVAGAAGKLLAAESDPNRRVIVLAATPLFVQLTMNLIVTPGMDATAIAAAVQTALADPVAGLFAPANLGIGQAIFDSAIEAACMNVQGVVAIGSAASGAAAPAITFAVSETSTAFATVDPGPVHAPALGAYYSLSEQNVLITTQADPYG